MDKEDERRLWKLFFVMITTGVIAIGLEGLWMVSTINTHNAKIDLLIDHIENGESLLRPPYKGPGEIVVPPKEGK